MEISVQLRPDVARALQRGDREEAPEAEAISRCADELGVRLNPVHPGETDPLLAVHFVAEAADEEAEAVARELRTLPGVDAAYIKPAAELP